MFAESSSLGLLLLVVPTPAPCVDVSPVAVVLVMLLAAESMASFVKRSEMLFSCMRLGRTM